MLLTPVTLRSRCDQRFWRIQAVTVRILEIFETCPILNYQYRQIDR